MKTTRDPMSDLRNLAKSGNHAIAFSRDILDAGADEIEKLRKQNKSLREKNKRYYKALDALCMKGRCPLAEEALGL